MKRRFQSLTILLLFLNFTYLVHAQTQTTDSYNQTSLRPALGFEYFSRTISWDGNQRTSKLKSFLFSVDLEFEIQEGFNMGVILGYTSSNYDGMAFRQLPFSVKLAAGSIGGYFFGGKLLKNIISQDNFEIDLYGQFVYFLGVKNNWSISDLNVEGTVEGKPTWMMAYAGPVFIYRGYEYFYPYVFVSLNKLWGTFKMDETIQTLTGSENKKFSEAGLISISPGLIYEVSESFSLKGQANIIPYNNGIDFGIMLLAVYAF